MEKFNNIPPIESTIPKPEQNKIWTAGFESPDRIIAKSGNVALGTNVGPRERNEDALVFDIEQDAFAVVDGMGGYENGDVAAQIVAKTIQKDFTKAESDPTELQLQSHLRMKEAGLRQGGAAYLAGRLSRNGKELSIYQAGDCQLMVIDSNGKIQFTSRPKPLQTVPCGNSPGQPEITKNIKIQNYDCIVVATDGLWDNVMPEKISEIVTNEKVDKAIQKLAELAKEGMQGDRGDGSYGNPDNITILIYQILPVPARGK